jgi:hypothetical protein
MYGFYQNQWQTFAQGNFPAQYSMCVGFGTVVPTAYTYAMAYNWQGNFYLINRLTANGIATAGKGEQGSRCGNNG